MRECGKADFQFWLTMFRLGPKGSSRAMGGLPAHDPSPPWADKLPMAPNGIQPQRAISTLWERLPAAIGGGEAVLLNTYGLKPRVPKGAFLC